MIFNNGILVKNKSTYNLFVLGTFEGKRAIPGAPSTAERLRRGSEPRIGRQGLPRAGEEKTGGKKVGKYHEVSDLSRESSSMGSGI